MILKGKNVIVTGSEGLLGKAIVADIKREGATVICLDINCVDDPKEHKYKVDLTKEKCSNGLMIPTALLKQFTLKTMIRTYLFV